MIDKERTLQLARMARVELPDDEVDVLVQELGAMLEFAARLEHVDVGDTPEWTPPPPEGRPLRPDTPGESLPRQSVLALAPSAQDGYFKVPRTLDEN